MQLASPSRGFTLIETLIYIGLLGIMIGGGTVGVYNIHEGAGRTRNNMYREQEASFVLRKIEAALSGATTITSPSPDTTSDTLELTGGAEPVTIDLSGDMVRLARGGEAPEELNAEGFGISDLAFERSTASSTLTTNFVLDGHPYVMTHYLRQ